MGQIRSLEYVFGTLAPWLRCVERITSVSDNLEARMQITAEIDADLAYVCRHIRLPARNAITFEWLLGRGDPSYEYDVLVFTDAATTTGVGGYVSYRDKWDVMRCPNFSVCWADTVLGYAPNCSVPDIIFYELLGLVAAIELYGPGWRGLTVHLRTDNTPAMWCLIKKCACFRRPDLNRLVRRVCDLTHRYRFRWWVSKRFVR